jgi:hypothetical protein
MYEVHISEFKYLPLFSMARVRVHTPTGKWVSGVEISTTQRHEKRAAIMDY